MRTTFPSRSALRSVPLLPLLLLAAPPASADSIRYSWTGTVEPASGQANPWNLAGDGSALTNGDGTPFVIQALVDEAADDLDESLNPDFARFATQATLLVGFEPASLSSAALTFDDDAFTGLFDSVDLSAQVERLGTTLSFAAGVRLPAASFDLVSPAAPDLAPLFATSHPIQFGGTGVSILVTMPDDAPVTAELVPWAAFPAATAVEWSSETAGVAGEIDVAIAGLADPQPTVVDLSLPAYAAAPAYAFASGLDYATGSTWTVTFSEPVASLLLFPRFWRGSGAGVDPVTFHLDAPFAIRSGLEGASVLGNAGGLVLSLPGSAFHDGVLQVQGPLTSLTVTPNTASSSQQAMAMAVVPMPSARPVHWTSPTTGTAGGVTVTLSDLGASASLQSADLSGADFAVAPLSASAAVVEYDTGADWTASFSEPVEGVLLYAKAWRGSDAGVDPVAYRFDAPFTILSGLREGKASEEGTRLDLPAADFHDGIVYVPGPLTSLSVEGDEPGDVAQALTLAVVPEPGAAAGGLASFASLLALRVRPPRRARACGAPAPGSSASGSARSARTPS